MCVVYKSAADDQLAARNVETKSNAAAFPLSPFLFLSPRVVLESQEPKASAGVPAISPHEVEKIGIGALHLDRRPFIYDVARVMKKTESCCVFELIDFRIKRHRKESKGGHLG